MPRQTTTPDKISNFAIGCVAISCLSGLVFTFSHNWEIRGATAGIGIMAAFFGTGVAGWFLWRIKNWKIILAALASLLPFSFWSCAIYRIANEGHP
jgi:hypothetical protein